MSLHDVGAAEVGAVGVRYSAALPLLGAILGWIMLSVGTKNVEFDLKPRYIKVTRVMLLVCVVYGFVAACVIQNSLSGHDGFVPGNAALAAGYINGASSCVTAMCIGWFGYAFAHAGFRQPKLFIGGVLVMIFIEAFALCGFIVSLVIMGRAGETQLDMAPGAVGPFASIDILANAGGAFGAMACGVAIMEVGVEQPHLVMRMLITVVLIGDTGIFGLISSITDTHPFPPSGNDSRIGKFYLLSSVGLAIVGFFGIRRAAGGDPDRYNEMVKLLIAMQSIGLAGLVSGLVMHSTEVAARPPSMSRDMPGLRSEQLSSEGIDGHVVAGVLGVALFFASMVGAAACAMRFRQSGRDLDAPLMES